MWTSAAPRTLRASSSNLDEPTAWPASRRAAIDLDIDRRGDAEVQRGRDHAARVETDAQVGEARIGRKAVPQLDRIFLGRVRAGFR